MSEKGFGEYLERLRSIHITRRGLFRAAVATAATAALGGCQPSPATQPAIQPAAKAPPATDAPLPQSAPATVAAPAARQSDTLVVATLGEPDTLDPGRMSQQAARAVLRNAYDGLVDIQEGDPAVKPSLATDWSVSADGRTYTFNLHKGVRFHDGTSLNSEAVKVSLDRIKRLKQFMSTYTEPIDAIEVVTDSQVKIHLTIPYSPFIQALQWFAIMSPTAIKEHTQGNDDAKAWFHDHAAGTGPYKVERWDAGQQLVLVRNNDYWRGWSGQHLGRVIQKLVKEAATQMLMLEKGDLDIAENLTIEDAEVLARNPDIDLKKNVTPKQFSVMMNVKKPPLDNHEIREALAYAFDYDAHNKGAMRGFAGEAAGPFPPETVGGVPNLPVRKQDVAKAKALLTGAGVPNGGFTLDMLIITGFDEHKKVAEVLFSSLRPLGITVNIVEMPNARWAQTLRDTPTAAHLYPHWVTPLINDPDAYLYYVYHSSAIGSGNNYENYSNPDVDRLLAQARAEVDNEKRNGLYRQAARQIEEDCVAIRVNRTVMYEGFRRWVHNYYFKPYMLQAFDYYELSLSGKPV